MSDKEILEIENLVGAVDSEEVRNETRLELYAQLVQDKEGNVKIPELYVDGIIAYCNKRFAELDGLHEESWQGNFLVYAARIAKHAGRSDQARQLYERAVNFNDENGYEWIAARTALEAGMENKAKELYGNIISDYEKKKDFKTAAEVADEAKMPEKAKAYRALEERLKIIGAKNNQY